ncbi:hypothetical protein HHL24_31450 [Paraburkholderia sp. RP-4-7]|uniref:Uncharacterized protein n=1 Tax=Paraburkholderia polaris TaxID=2728848 RepID=A0A848INC0_9BURK|nr:hypothetical protein [Paraburkholderia polaris]NMM02426.1 hypothetical protein [Paraburkholderia polaris]
MTLGVLAFSGQVTIVDQEGKHEATMFRFLCAYAGAGGKKLLPFGIGGGLKTLYCCDLFYEAELDQRKERVTNRDPCQRTRDLANENLLFYWLELEQKSRYEQSLLTHGGQRRLLEQVQRYSIRLLIIDCEEDWTLVAGKETAEYASASFSELLEELTSQGVSVLIFTSGAKGRKAIPTLLGSLPGNRVSIKEDKNHPMTGGLRLLISREASHDGSSVPRKFVWWSKIEAGNFEFSCREEHFDDQRSPVREVQDERRERIKTLIAAGVTTQKELAERLDCDPATVNRDIRKLFKHGEVVMHPTTKKLSLPGSVPADDEDDSADAAQGELWD